MENSKENPQKIIPPSKIPPTKPRRKKGEGTGYIYHRLITRKGNQYQEFYYRYRDDSGKLRSKYIPQRLLNKVKEAEAGKKPVAELLILLGGDEISRGELFPTSNPEKPPKSKPSEQLITLSRGEQKSPPSKKRGEPASPSGQGVPHVEMNSARSPSALGSAPRLRRQQGYGAGYIECKPIKRSGKEYPQYWYHYEFWLGGDRIIKRTRYISKSLLSRVQELDEQKVPVREILKLLGVKL